MSCTNKELSISNLTNDILHRAIKGFRLTVSQIAQYLGEIQQIRLWPKFFLSPVLIRKGQQWRQLSTLPEASTIVDALQFKIHSNVAAASPSMPSVLFLPPFLPTWGQYRNDAGRDRKRETGSLRQDFEKLLYSIDDIARSQITRSAERL